MKDTYLLTQGHIPENQSNGKTLTRLALRTVS
jgi:hypothetical protein